MKGLKTVLQDWEAVIGLEVHVELTTLNTKMFCACPISYGDDPNTHTCPVCLGMPGALPVPNRAAIESIVLAGLATGCSIQKRSMFYRKNYFYPDMSKNFQTTQGPIAFCMHGAIDLEIPHTAATVPRAGMPERDAYTAHIGITRIHLEEDAGKTVHVGGTDGRISGATYSLLDYNRCGTPLIELVTEPDLRTPEEARLFLQKLRQVFLTLGISDCSMEQGSLRCDGNVSLRRYGAAQFGTKTELKNMNSFKNLHDGLTFEICRQAEVLEEGDAVRQETRHWEPAAKRTITMRVKETADDYRLFPEPDLAPYDLSDEFIEAVRARLPELPDAKKRRYVSTCGLPTSDAAALAGDVELSRFFDEALTAQPALAKPIANLLLNEVSAWLNAHSVEGLTLVSGKVTPAALAELAKLTADGTISSHQGKEVFALMAATGDTPARIVEERGMKQVSDAGAIEQIVSDILAANPQKVEEYRSGKTGLRGFFVGQAMKATQGQGNPQLINEIITKKLEG
ncbi:MAG: Asp-tRNA(Asn)/Glu-tRNA(Gln) amidotransferase subunit GatB [Coriobacteriales bacterium]|jgi:aspartyl-tRNA(Asn)/glutamyl-tRNA(Gln) amidotransferase subunit B|nr:Asp-tRNA(Asn)/Glu-tRNA(Gln) amidotransferase subunit GatB [Coriobacteriales bacterium]